jgi:hypothetical protein
MATKHVTCPDAGQLNAVREITPHPRAQVGSRLCRRLGY